MHKHFTLIGGLLLLFILSACGGLAGEPIIVSTTVPQPTRNPEATGEELGRLTFEARCASCHGLSGLGDGPVAIEAGLEPANFTVQATSADQSLTEWTNTIRFGRIESMMPPWENSLSSEEIEAVAAYTYTFWQSYDQTQIESSSPTTVPEMTIEAQGSVSGEVLLGTADGTMPDIISIALQVIDPEGNEAFFEMQVLESTSDYRFDDVLIKNDNTYFITAIYNDIVFYSDIRFGIPDSPEMTMPVTIYETTSDESVIEIDLFLMRLIPDETGVIIQQVVNFHNNSDRVYRGDNQIDSFTYDSVRLPLPAEAELLNTVELIPRFLMLAGENGESLQTLLDTQAVLPASEHLVEVVYSLPIDITEAQRVINLPIRYPVTSPIELMTEPSQYQIVSDDFESTGTQHFSVGVYESYVSEPLEANTSIQFDIQIASDDGNSEEKPSNDLVALMVLAGVFLMISSGIILFVSRLDAPQSANDDPASS